MFDALIVAICEQAFDPGICTTELNVAVNEAVMSGLELELIEARLNDALAILEHVNPDDSPIRPVGPTGGTSWDFRVPTVSGPQEAWSCVIISDEAGDPSPGVLEGLTPSHRLTLI